MSLTDTTGLPIDLCMSNIKTTVILTSPAKETYTFKLHANMNFYNQIIGLLLLLLFLQ